MRFFDDYNRRRLELTRPESGKTLDHLKLYFQDDANWTQSMYLAANGARCMVAAANHIRVSAIDDAKYWLRLAIAEVAPDVTRIEDFNDRSTYAEVMAVIERARELAAQGVIRALPAPPAGVVEILPPQRRSVPPVTSPSPRRTRQRRSLAEWLMD